MSERRQYNQGRQRQQPAPSAKPRRVRHGLRLRRKEGAVAESWVALAWFARFEGLADDEQHKEGLAYARGGQTTKLAAAPGEVRATVVGRQPGAYDVRIKVRQFSGTLWDRVLATMGGQALYAAKLLAGQLPQSVEPVFADEGEALIPTADDLELSCTCDVPDPCCKHIVCAAALLAEQLDGDPFLLFTLRGLDGESFLERLQHQRAMEQKQGRPVPAYQHSPPAGASGGPAPLPTSVDEFWTAGAELAEITAEPGPPRVEHALLRRLGPAPFKDSRFPFVGLLATCYDTASRHALEKLAESASPDAPEADEAVEEASAAGDDAPSPADQR